jgi:beta-lactamase superfamily II metal-dependent hydrolase
VWLGEGNAMLLQSGDHSVLIDGSSRPFRLLERLGAELPYDSHGIDAVIVTDPRASNVAGLRAVVQHYHVGEVLDVGVEHPSSTYASWRGDLRALRVPVFALRTGVTMRIGGITIRAVAPDGLRYRAQDSAAMVRVDARANRVMLAGIASEQEQHEAVFQANYLHADVLVAPGSGCDAAFLRQVSPRVIFSRSCRGAHTTRPLKSGSVLASFH